MIVAGEVKTIDRVGPAHKILNRMGYISSATAMFTTIFLLLLIALVLCIVSRSKAHERETGLSPPSAETLASIEREARERQIPACRAYSEWIAREQRAQSISGRASRTETAATR